MTGLAFWLQICRPYGPMNGGGWLVLQTCRPYGPLNGGGAGSTNMSALRAYEWGVAGSSDGYIRFILQSVVISQFRIYSIPFILLQSSDKNIMVIFQSSENWDFPLCFLFLWQRNPGFFPTHFFLLTQTGFLTMAQISENKEICIPANLPFLKAVCWQTKNVRHFTLPEMLSRYERGWNYRGVLADLEGEELDFVRNLVKKIGSWTVRSAMFEQSHHQKVITILNSLRSDFFIEISAYFGGGTLLTLSYNEYRRSMDIDFICPVGEGYRKLRSEIYDKAYEAVFKDFSDISLPRKIKADQYGVRFVVVVENVPIKFEIVAEARIVLESPEFRNWSPVPCLNFTDTCAEKLLSNTDRWADRASESRDLIDLSVLRLHSEIPKCSIGKAESAYPVLKPLQKAIKFFQAEPGHRNSSFSSLQVRDRAKIIDGLDLLASDFGISSTKRRDDEYPAY